MWPKSLHSWSTRWMESKLRLSTRWKERVLLDLSHGRGPRAPLPAVPLPTLYLLKFPSPPRSSACQPRPKAPPSLEVSGNPQKFLQPLHLLSYLPGMPFLTSLPVPTEFVHSLIRHVCWMLTLGQAESYAQGITAVRELRDLGIRQVQAHTRAHTITSCTDRSRPYQGKEKVRVRSHLMDRRNMI